MRIAPNGNSITQATQAMIPCAHIKLIFFLGKPFSARATRLLVVSGSADAITGKASDAKVSMCASNERKEEEHLTGTLKKHLPRSKLDFVDVRNFQVIVNSNVG